MPITNVLTVFLILAFFSLVFVSYINRRQLRNRLVSQKVVQMKRRILDLEAQAAVIEPLLENMRVVQIVYEEIIELAEKTSKLDSNRQHPGSNMTNAQTHIERISSHPVQNNLWRIQQSDSSIAKAQYALNEAGRIVRRRHAAGFLEKNEMETCIHDLAWAKLMVTTISMVAQGHQTLVNGNTLKAYAFYNKAQQILLQANNADERKPRMIKEIGEIMSNRRKALSLDLMPESDFNPGSGSPKLIPPETPEP